MAKKSQKAEGPPVRPVPHPPQRRVPDIPILVVRPGEPAYLTVVSSALLGVEVHYPDGRTRDCAGAHAGCRWCKEGHSRAWKGYLHCLLHRRGQERKSVIAQVTPWTVDHCPQLLHYTAGLRGGQLVLTRAGERIQSRLEATWKPPAECPKIELPVEVDVAQVLRHVYDGESRRAGVRPVFGVTS